MSTGLQTVLEIAGIGTVLLFLALAGLVGLMYAVTSPRLSDKLNLNDDEDANTEADMASRADRAASEAKHEAEAEADRQRRAVALAVATACEIVGQSASHITENPSEWRQLHRARRFAQAVRRQGGRA